MRGDVLATLRRPFGDDLATFGRRSGAPELRAEMPFCLRVADRDGCRTAWPGDADRQRVNARTSPNQRHIGENSGVSRAGATDVAAP